MNKKVIIFDLDGTLIDSMKIWHEVDIIFLGKRGIPVSDDIFDDLKTNSIVDMAIFVKEKFALAESIEEIMTEWIDETKYYYENTLKLRPGAFDFITYLKQNNYTLAVGTSNSLYLAEAVLRQNKIYDYFSTIVAGCSNLKGKPEPDIYLQVCENLGCSPEDCLVFEDSLVWVQAAKNAGMMVYAIEDETAAIDKEEIRKLADEYFVDYEEILHLRDSFVNRKLFFTCEILD